MTRSLALAALISFTISAIVGRAEEPKPGNIAPQAKASASSTHPQYPLAGVNDNRMDTQWSTAQGKTTGQWLQLDWDTPQEICGVALHATGPWTQTIDVQVNREGTWVSVGKSGSSDEKTAATAGVAKQAASRQTAQGAALILPPPLCVFGKSRRPGGARRRRRRPPKRRPRFPRSKPRRGCRPRRSR